MVHSWKKKVSAALCLVTMGFAASACGDDDVSEAARVHDECFAYCVHMESCSGQKSPDCYELCGELYDMIDQGGATAEAGGCIGEFTSLAHCANEASCAQLGSEDPICVDEAAAMARACRTTAASSAR